MKERERGRDRDRGSGREIDSVRDVEGDRKRERGWDGMGWDGMGWDVKFFYFHSSILFCFTVMHLLWSITYLDSTASSEDL